MKNDPLSRTVDAILDAITTLMGEDSTIHPGIVANAMLNALVVVVAHSLNDVNDLDEMTRTFAAHFPAEVKRHLRTCEDCDPALRAQANTDTSTATSEVAMLEAMYNLPPRGSC